MRVYGMQRGEGVGFYRADDPRAYDLPVPGGRQRMTAEMAVGLYRDDLEELLADAEVFPDIIEALESLRGKDLACWCPLDQPCHADVLIEFANRPEAGASAYSG